MKTLEHFSTKNKSILKINLKMFLAICGKLGSFKINHDHYEPYTRIDAVFSYLYTIVKRNPISELYVKDGSNKNLYHM